MTDSLKLTEERPLEEVLKLLREVPLLNSDIKIYRTTNINLKKFDTDSIRPTALYLLKDKLRDHKALHDLMLKEYGIDTFSLDKGLTYEFNGHTYHMAPPIVEYSETDGCDIIVDGAHRSYVARQQNLPISGFYIQGVDKKYTLFALPATWEQIVEYDKTPAMEKKRLYRFKDYDKNYTLYRDLSLVCTTGPRKIDTSV